MSVYPIEKMMSPSVIIIRSNIHRGIFIEFGTTLKQFRIDKSRDNRWDATSYIEDVFDLRPTRKVHSLILSDFLIFNSPSPSPSRC